MYTLTLILHFIVCILLILLVLLQSGKGSAAGIFGASGADNLFASPTAFNAINKFTAILALILMCTSVVLTIASNKKSRICELSVDKPLRNGILKASQEN